MVTYFRRAALVLYATPRDSYASPVTRDRQGVTWWASLMFTCRVLRDTFLGTCTGTFRSTNNSVEPRLSPCSQVTRTGRGGFIPVYRDIRNGGTRTITVVRKVTGDLEASSTHPIGYHRVLGSLAGTYPAAPSVRPLISIKRHSRHQRSVDVSEEGRGVGGKGSSLESRLRVTPEVPSDGQLELKATMDRIPRNCFRVAMSCVLCRPLLDSDSVRFRTGPALCEILRTPPHANACTEC